jgi:hypothetical protein
VGTAVPAAQTSNPWLSVLGTCTDPCLFHPLPPPPNSFPAHSARC